jgi:hypothetical protein
MGEHSGAFGRNQINFNAKSPRRKAASQEKIAPDELDFVSASWRLWAFAFERDRNVSGNRGRCTDRNSRTKRRFETFAVQRRRTTGDAVPLFSLLPSVHFDFHSVWISRNRESGQIHLNGSFSTVLIGVIRLNRGCLLFESAWSVKPLQSKG